MELHLPLFLARAAFSLLSLLPSRAPSLFSLLASACCLPPRPFRSLASFAVLAAVVSFGLLFGPRCVWPRVVGVGVVFGFLLGLFLPSLFVVFLLVVWWADWLLAH